MRVGGSAETPVGSKSQFVNKSEGLALPMYERILYRIRKDVRSGDYVVTKHAKQELNEDGLTIYDLEQAILDGQIIHRQRDAQTGEFKYLTQDVSSEEGIELVVKISPLGQPVVITIYTI